MTETSPKANEHALKAKIAVLEELLSVQEQVVAEQSRKLNDAMSELAKNITELQISKARQQEYGEQLEQANEEIRRFAYTVSHDLRTPLVNLRGFSGELRANLKALAPIIETARPHLNENQTRTASELIQHDMPESLGFIDAAVTQMNHLTNSLLRLSRLGRKELYFEDVDMNALVSEACQRLEKQAEKAQARIHIGSLPGVVADRTAMRQIMDHLLENAINYLQPGRPGKIEVGGRHDAEKTVFFVRDNGRGIAREDMAKVFAPFRRAGRQDVQGAGMGLAYVQTLVHRHGGGRVRCESEPGVGTTFTFSIPHPLQQGESHG